MDMGRQRIVQLDGIRGFAVAAVFLHHAFSVPMLWLGVDLFFILSGFLITGILLGDQRKTRGAYFADFYKRRAKRILPPYVLLMVFASLVLGVESWLHHWYLYLFLMNFVVAFQIPHPHSLMMLWSLAVEEQFYFFWPLVVFYFDETAVAGLAVTLLVVVPVLRGLCTPLFSNEWPIYTLMPFRMDCLAAGALLAVIWRKAPELLEKYGRYGLVLPLISLVGLQWLGRNGITTSGDTVTGNIMVYEFSLWGCFGVMTWALSGKSIGLLKFRPIVYLGRISYTVYLVQMLMLQICSKFSSDKWAIAGSAGVLTLGYATLSWFFLESPILQRRIPALRWVTQHAPQADEPTGAFK